MLNPSPQHSTFDKFLKHEFSRRKAESATFSLRTFAKLLDTDVSQLSKVLRGLRPVTSTMIAKLGPVLQLPTEQIVTFQETLNMSRKFPQLKTEELTYQAIPFEAFSSVTDYRHSLILELMKLQDFSWDAAWLAKPLKCSEPEALAYIQRVRDAGLLKVDETSQLSHSNWSISFRPTENLTSAHHRRSQEEILTMAIQALHTIPIEKRDQSSMMMATNREKILEAKKKITAFRRELCAFLEDTPVKDSVYQLSLSLFPLVDEN